jgi:hypothetical protein
MRPFVLVVGAVLLAIGLLIALSAAVDAAACEAQSAPCTQDVCPFVVSECPWLLEVLLVVGLVIPGAVLVVIGIRTKSANQITEEVLAGLHQ